MNDPTTPTERREIRRRAEAARGDGLCAGLLNVDPRRLLTLLDERDALKAENERLREQLREMKAETGPLRLEAADERAGLELCEAELAADRAAARALVEALPECDMGGCDDPATTEFWRDFEDRTIACDTHRYEVSGDLDYAAPLRALQARMATWEAGEGKSGPADDDSPRCEVCRVPVREDDPGKAFDAEDSVWACGGCVQKIDADDHRLDVARLRQALEVDADVSAAIVWPAFWSRRARLGKAAEAIEEPVKATVEWMAHERAAEQRERGDDSGARPPLAEGQTWRLPCGVEVIIERRPVGEFVGRGPHRLDYVDGNEAPPGWSFVCGPGGGTSAAATPAGRELASRPVPLLVSAIQSHLDTLHANHALIPSPRAEVTFDPATKRIHARIPTEFSCQLSPVPPEPDGDEETAYDVGAGRDGGRFRERARRAGPLPVSMVAVDPEEHGEGG